MDDSRPTEWLASLGSDPVAASKLEEYMRMRARALAAKWIGNRAQAGVGPTDVAASAVASLFIDLVTGQIQPADSTSLLRVLAFRLRNKAIDALRKRNNDKRNVGREESATLPLPDTGDSPDDLAMFSELAERIVELIEEEPDELRRLVTYLAIVEGRTAAEIVAAIEAGKVSDEVHVPSISAIYVWLRAARARIEGSLRKDGFLDDE